MRSPHSVRTFVITHVQIIQLWLWILSLKLNNKLNSFDLYNFEIFKNIITIHSQRTTHCIVLSLSRVFFNRSPCRYQLYLKSLIRFGLEPPLRLLLALATLSAGTTGVLSGTRDSAAPPDEATVPNQRVSFVDCVHLILFGDLRGAWLGVRVVPASSGVLSEPMR